MIAIEQLQPGTLAAIKVQPGQAGELAAIADLRLHGHYLCQKGPALQVLRDGVPVAAGGLVEIRPHHATAWAYVGADAGPAMVALTRAVRRVIGARAYERVDTTVRASFDAGYRWATLLGFDDIALLRKWGADRSDHILFERIS